MNSDFLILGGGAMGLSLAYELSTQGSVALVDTVDRRPASWAAAGLLPTAAQIDAHDSYRQLVTLGGQLHERWAAELEQQTEISIEYRRCGGLHLARSSGEAAALMASVTQWRDEGVEVLSIDPDRLRQVEPLLAATPCQARFLIPAEAQIRPPRLLKALRIACSQRGAQFIAFNAEQEAVGFEREGDRLIAVRVGDKRLTADRFCFAAGAWTRRLLDLLGIGIEVTPIRGQMALFGPGAVRLNHIINEGPNYIVPRRDGRILVGSTVEEVEFDARTTSEGQARLLALAREMVPALADASLESTWAGLRPRTGDGFPYIGAVPGMPNAFLATGHYRSGILLAPATAQQLTRLIHGDSPSIDLRPFRLDRE